MREELEELPSLILRLSRYISWRVEENQNVTFMTTLFTLAYTSGVKGAAAFKSIPDARWLFWVMASLQLGQRTDFIKLFGQPGHHQAAAHKHLPQVVYNSATVGWRAISAAVYILSIKAEGLEHSSEELLLASSNAIASWMAQISSLKCCE